MLDAAVGIEGENEQRPAFGAGSGKRVYWTVTVMTDAAISSVTLDPATGAFVRRDDVKLK